jgi:pantoate kinase
MREASAFSPAGISSFFEIHDKRADGRPFKDLSLAGARGGGLVISKGVLTQVRLKHAKKSHISVRINNRRAEYAKTTISAITRLLQNSGDRYEVAVEHHVEVPIGAGYGASAAGSLSAALAFSDSADMGMSINEIGRVVHEAEIASGTGLGTVGPILTGGFILTRKSGGPGIALIDRLPASQRLKVVSGCFGPISTKKALESVDLRRKVNALGKATFRSIARDLRPQNFMSASKKFALSLGLMSPQTAKLIALMENTGAIGATQNMLGQAVHAIAGEDEAGAILTAVKRRFPKAKAFMCSLDLAGARLL